MKCAFQLKHPNALLNRKPADEKEVLPLWTTYSDIFPSFASLENVRWHIRDLFWEFYNDLPF